MILLIKFKSHFIKYTQQNSNQNLLLGQNYFILLFSSIIVIVYNITGVFSAPEKKLFSKYLAEDISQPHFACAII